AIQRAFVVARSEGVHPLVGELARSRTNQRIGLLRTGGLGHEEQEGKQRQRAPEPKHAAAHRGGVRSRSHACASARVSERGAPALREVWLWALRWTRTARRCR